MFPKPRFYVIAAAIVAFLAAYEYWVKGEVSDIPQVGLAALIMAGYMIVLNGSGAMVSALMYGTEGSKYFRSVPNAYRTFRSAVLLNEILGLLMTAAICLFVLLAGLGERKLYLLLLAGEIILSGLHFSMRAKSKTQSLLIMSGIGGLIGGGIGSILVGEELPLFVIQIVTAVFGAVWIFSTVFLYKDLRKLWDRD